MSRSILFFMAMVLLGALMYAGLNALVNAPLPAVVPLPAARVTDAMGMEVAVVRDGSATLSAAEIYATQCVVDTPSGGRILLWEMFGSPTPTPLPADFTPAPTPQPGSAARGERLFTGEGECINCHSIEDDTWLVGPPLRQVASRAGDKRPGMSAQDYLRAVILDPGVIYPPAMPGVMPTTYGSQFEVGQIEDLVAYLMTLR